MASSTAPNITEPLEWTEVEKVILTRRSTRAFKKEAIPDYMIRRILEAGRFAPSAGNSQPWRFAVVKSPEILSAMEADAVKISKRMMFVLDYTRSRLRNILLKPISKFFIRLRYNELHPVPFGLLAAIANERAPVFHHAPALILLFEDQRGVSCPATDIGICGENMVLAAHSLGLGTCYISLPMEPLKMPLMAGFRKKLGIPSRFEAVTSLALGYPKGKIDSVVRRDTPVTTWFR